MVMASVSFLSPDRLSKKIQKVQRSPVYTKHRQQSEGTVLFAHRKKEKGED
jgi:hypothetical protein